MTVTYRFGYGEQRLTLDQMITRQTWVMLHPEFRRRLLTLFDDARAAGKDIGIGEGWRSSEQQSRVFFERHLEVPAGGCCRVDGKRYQLKPGVAHAAPPFRSYHESVGFPTGLWAAAADLVGDITWAHPRVADYGLVHFTNVNNEPWHFQPAELPRSRTNYSGTELDTAEVDMICLDYQPNTSGWVATLWCGDTLSWIVDGHADQVLRNAGVKRVTVTKDQFAGVIRSSKTGEQVPSGLPADLSRLWKAQQ